MSLAKKRFPDHMSHMSLVQYEMSLKEVPDSNVRGSLKAGWQGGIIGR
jgi:hypothetical protein